MKKRHFYVVLVLLLLLFSMTQYAGAVRYWCRDLQPYHGWLCSKTQSFECNGVVFDQGGCQAYCQQPIHSYYFQCEMIEPNKYQGQLIAAKQ